MDDEFCRYLVLDICDGLYVIALQVLVQVQLQEKLSFSFQPVQLLWQLGNVKLSYPHPSNHLMGLNFLHCLSFVFRIKTEGEEEKLSVLLHRIFTRTSDK